jgi:hypothetical protein
MAIDWGKLGYTLACVALPALWGGFAAWLFGRLDARRKAKAPSPERPPLDYTI